MGQRAITGRGDAFTVSGPIDRVMAAMCDARVWYGAFCPHDRDPQGSLVDAGRQRQQGVPGVGARFTFVRTDLQRRSHTETHGNTRTTTRYHAEVSTTVNIELTAVEGKQLVFSVDETWRQFNLIMDFSSTSQNKTSVEMTNDGSYRDCLCGGSDSCQANKLKEELNTAGRNIQHDLQQVLGDGLGRAQMR